MRESSIGGALLGAIARPPLPLLRLVGSLPAMGLSETVFFVPMKGRRLALTLDDGPHPDTTPAMLEILDKHRCQATFFLHGCRSERWRELMHAIAEAGHELGNHTWEDTPSRKLSSAAFHESLNRTHQILTDAGSGNAREVKLFRPAGGLPSEEMVTYAKAALDYQCVLASLYPLDTRVSSSSWIVEAVARRAHRGAIILLHEGRGRARITAILDEVLTRIGASYEVTTVSHLLSSAKS